MDQENLLRENFNVLFFIDINCFDCYYNYSGDIVKNVNLRDLHLDIVELLDVTQVARLYKTNDNKVFKFFDMDYLISMLDNGYDIEKKVLYGGELINVPEIVVPDSAVYDGNNFVGYTMPFFDGISIYDFVEYNRHNFSLDFLTNFFLKLEDVVKKSENVVFPDLLSNGNILVNRTDMRLIDFDGLQIGEFKSPAISSSLGNMDIYDSDKYKKDGLYTKNIDIKSLIYLYFDLVFDCELRELDNIGLNYGSCMKNERLKFLFNYYNINDSELFDKVWRLYIDNESNIYLGDTINYIASNYKLDSKLYDLINVRKLVKK